MKINANKLKVGKRILAVRSKMKLTLEDFGKIFNAEKSNVSKWERGQSLPSRARLEKIAKLGDMTVNELLYGSVEEYIKENFDELIRFIMADLVLNQGYQFSSTIYNENTLNYFLTPEINAKLSVNDEKAIHTYIKNTIIKKFPRDITPDEMLFMEYYNFFATISTVSKDITPNYTSRLKELNKLYNIMFDYIEENLTLFVDEYNKDEVHEQLDKIKSLREKDN